MFGAYQAGVWEVLSDTFTPDLVVGASIGALNAWAIAGGCPREELRDLWLDVPEAAAYRWRVPRNPLGGIVDANALEGRIRNLHARFRPRMPIGIVITDLLRLRPVLVQNADITWEHLAASCAVLGVLPQVRLNGRVFSDGGLLGALPLWAAVEMGADRIVAINAMPRMPATVRTAVSALRSLSRHRPPDPVNVEVTAISASARLGGVRDAVFWNRDNAERWLKLGRRDAVELKHSIPAMF